MTGAGASGPTGAAPTTAPPTRRSIAVAGHTDDAAGARLGLASDDPAVRGTALGALERLGALGDNDVAIALVDADPSVRRRAATVAARHRAVDLHEALFDLEPRVVEVVAWACGERDAVSDDVLARLIDLATVAAADPLVRESSVAALGAIGDDRGLQAILTATTDKPAVRRRAVLALAPFLDPDHPRAAAVAATLERAAGDRDWQVRQAAEDLMPTDDQTGLTIVRPHRGGC